MGRTTSPQASATPETQKTLSDLARVKAVFQQRTIKEYLTDQPAHQDRRQVEEEEIE